MELKMVRLHSDDERWLELKVQSTGASACVGNARGASETFPFSFDNLGLVVHGMGYQAWGSGSHFSFRHDSNGIVVEFQGPTDRSAAICRISHDRLTSTLDDLDARASRSRASVL